MNNKTLANIVKNSREKLGISQRELSRRTGIDNNTISNIEKGQRKKPNILSLRKLSFALKLNLEELMKLSNYSMQDIEVSLNNNTILNKNLDSDKLKDIINSNQNELYARKMLKEIIINTDYSKIETLNKLSSKEKNKVIKSFKKIIQENNNDIKNLKASIKKANEILIKKIN